MQGCDMRPPLRRVARGHVCVIIFRCMLHENANSLRVRAQVGQREITGPRRRDGRHVLRPLHLSAEPHGLRVGRKTGAVISPTIAADYNFKPTIMS